MDIQAIARSLTQSGGLQQAADEAGLSHDQAQGVLQGVLAHLEGGGSGDRLVQGAAQRAGVAPEVVQALLPQIMGLLRNHAQTEEGASAGAGELSQMLGAALGGSSGNGEAGGLMGEAESLLGRL